MQDETGRRRGARRRTANPKAAWTKAKEAIFFRELATVCNVAAALRAAGMARGRGPSRWR